MLLKFTKFILSTCVVLSFSCRNHTISTDPYYPNYGITRIDLERNGWELNAQDYGVCAFNQEYEMLQVAFYFSTDDDCTVAGGQEIYVSLNYPHSYQYVSDLQDFTLLDEELLLTEIDSILHTFDSKRVSDLAVITSCRLQFSGENSAGKRMDWDVNFCFDRNSLSAYASLKDDEH